MRKLPHLAYQLEDKDGGYQLFKLTLDDDHKVILREKVESPDSWDQVISYLELELSRQFA
jgi:hypothetical protein